MFANVHDTLLAHHTYASHYPQRLDHVVSEYCDAAPWKVQHGMRDIGEKGAVKEGMGGEELCLYNGQDCRLTALAWERMQPDLAQEATVYEHDRRLAHLCHEMQWAGVEIDLARRAELTELLILRREGLRLQLCEALGNPRFEPAKLPQVREALFETLGAVGSRKTPGGQYSTNDLVLEGYAGIDTELGRFCEALLTWRLVGKILSTYLEAVVVHGTRAHYGWKPFGTVSGRLASRVQSCPRYAPLGDDKVTATPEGRAREIYVAAPGKVLVYYDVSQAEMRLAAFLSSDPVFMQVASESDVHAGNAATVFPDVAAKGWLVGKAKGDPAKGKPYRDIAKNLGFAISYGAEADKVYVTLRRKGFPVTMRQVELVLMKLRASYKVYYQYITRNVDRVRFEGFMRSPLLGRIRWFGRYPKPTEIANYPVQSALADIVNMRMLRVAPLLPKGTSLVMQIHDACVYECWARDAATVEAIIDEEWGYPVPLPGGDLVLPIDRKRAERWSDL